MSTIQDVFNFLHSEEMDDVTFVLSANQCEQNYELKDGENESSLDDDEFNYSNQKIFRVNRIFLATISPVFKAMLYGKTKESKKNALIPLKGIDPFHFEQIIKYIVCLIIKKHY